MLRSRPEPGMTAGEALPNMNNQGRGSLYIVEGIVRPPTLSKVSIHEEGERRLVSASTGLPCLLCHELAPRNQQSSRVPLWCDLVLAQSQCRPRGLGDEGGVRDMMLPSLGGRKGIGLWATAPHRSPTSPQDAVNGAPIGDPCVLCCGFLRVQPTAPRGKLDLPFYPQYTNHAGRWFKQCQPQRPSRPRQQGS
jgi:hypothetical protein